MAFHNFLPYPWVHTKLPVVKPLFKKAKPAVLTKKSFYILYLTLTFIIWKVLEFLNKFYMSFKSDVDYAYLYYTVYKKMHYVTNFCVRLESQSSQFFLSFNVEHLKRTFKDFLTNFRKRI